MTKRQACRYCGGGSIDMIAHEANCVMRPTHVEWTPVKDDRVRPVHRAATDHTRDYFNTVTPPPFQFGKFNCRGDYVLSDDEKRAAWEALRLALIKSGEADMGSYDQFKERHP